MTRHLHHQRLTTRSWEGLSRGRTPRDFPKTALARGVAVEMEHTRNPAVARRIAMDHLTEDPRYYEKLARMEKGACDKLVKLVKRRARNRQMPRIALTQTRTFVGWLREVQGRLEQAGWDTRRVKFLNTAGCRGPLRKRFEAGDDSLTVASDLARHGVACLAWTGGKSVSVRVPGARVERNTRNMQRRGLFSSKTRDRGEDIVAARAALLDQLERQPKGVALTPERAPHASRLVEDGLAFVDTGRVYASNRGEKVARAARSQAGSDWFTTYWVLDSLFD